MQNNKIKGLMKGKSNLGSQHTQGKEKKQKNDSTCTQIKEGPVGEAPRRQEKFHFFGQKFHFLTKTSI